jgi:hypothetical protein
MSEKKTAIVMEESRVERNVRNEVQRQVGLTGIRRTACASLQNALAAGVLIFYSRSLLGTVIRAFVS